MFSKSFVAAVAAASVVVGGPLLAHSYNAGDLVIGHPWARETAPGQSVGGGFMSIANNGARADRLLGGSTPVAKAVQIHSLSMNRGVMKMRPVSNGLAVPAKGTIMLKPGGYHIMLIGLKQPLARGQRVPVTLRFQRAGDVRVELAVAPVGTTGPAKDAGEGHRHD